uniref:NADP-dependent oxidoreductase domain-containing protein n=2 Tax=Clastoptera arizonana TaxID=38151 RepID=A0A1B6E9W6_9HEMI
MQRNLLQTGFFAEIEKSLEDQTTLEDNWKAMESCVKLGLTRSIGLSNYNSQQIERILKVAQIKPVTNQVECHPYLNQKELISFCKEREIILTAYAPLCSPSKSWSQDKPKLLEDPRLLKLSERHGKSTAQIVLRYLYQLGTVPIPKSSNEKRLKENINIFDFNLSSEDMKILDSLNENTREFLFLGAKKHKEYPFTIPF